MMNLIEMLLKKVALLGLRWTELLGPGLWLSLGRDLAKEDQVLEKWWVWFLLHFGFLRKARAVVLGAVGYAGMLTCLTGQISWSVWKDLASQ